MKKRYEVKYNLIIMNIVGTVYTVFLCLLTYFLINGPLGHFFPAFNYSIIKMVILFLIYIFWMCLHEFIHGIFYCIGGTKWQNVSFGVALEKGILFCKCRKLITKKNAMISLQAPLVIIGIITYIISLIIGSYGLLFLSIANIYGACGDILVFLFFTKLPKDTKFKEIGDTSTFMLETKEDISNKKSLGIKEIRLMSNDEELEDNTSKKIEISKKSIIYMIILLIILALDIILSL